MMLALHACGGGGGSAGSSGTVAGSLEVIVNGLPSGTAASITVTGPGFEQTIEGPQTLANLAAGTYVVNSADVVNGTSIFRPDEPSQIVMVAGASAQSVTVSYTAQGSLALALQPVASGLTSPVFLTAPPEDERLFIVERPGRIRIVQDGALLAAPFLTIESRISTNGEGGLLSMAFDPQYATNGFFYVYFTNTDGDIAVERFTVSSADPNTANLISGTPIITIPHTASSRHYGGQLDFGPDNLLYIATGDGGSPGDALGNAQNTNGLLGKLLRIDVSFTGLTPYAIPSGNPFVGQAGRRPEIWAYGLRNPWRYSFDSVGGLLYLSDVGEGRREEINVAGASRGGLNYGWNITEGSLCFPGDPCDTQGLTLPTLEYVNGFANSCAVIGGYVYRGSAIPELQGRYFYSDLCGGWLKSFAYRSGSVTEQVQWMVPSLASINSFGQDAQKELYVLLGNGNVFRIVRQ